MSLLYMLPSPALPAALHRTMLSRLFGATAAAFRCSAPSLRGLATPELLSCYASFTAEQVQSAMREGQDLRTLQARLYAQAFTLGRWCGRLMGVRTMLDAMVAGRALYRNLDIDFRGNGQGQVVIPRCFFSRWYTADVCRIMSAMDRGILAGLLGGGDLAFHARITEGAPCCLARFGAPSRGRAS
mgnify:CR=1 FL=1